MAAPIRSYSIPIDDMTIDERRNRRQTAYANALQQATGVSIRPQGGDYAVRVLLPNEDAGLTTFEDWLVATTQNGSTPATIAAAALTYINVAAVAQTKVYVVFGFGLLSYPQKLSRIDWRNNASLYNISQVEHLEAQVRRWAYFAEDMNWLPNDGFQVNVYSRTGGFPANTQRLPLDGFVAEPATATLSARSAA